MKGRRVFIAPPTPGVRTHLIPRYSRLRPSDWAAIERQIASHFVGESPDNPCVRATARDVIAELRRRGFLIRVTNGKPRGSCARGTCDHPDHIHARTSTTGTP